MPSVSHEGPSLATGEVRQAFGPTLDHFPQSFGSAKVRHKKHPAKEKFVGWEFVGVLVGVLPFFPISVGVFGFSVGVLRFWWEFWWEFLFFLTS